ncbi:MAG: hypothetical protein LBM98_09650 [Oscillospiraceae bacterium]|nr:hypothetical protein [Oscillospiraceae bacterium]
MLRRVSLTTYRKCGGGFAKTVRRPGAPRAGHSPALFRRLAPERWTGDASARRGNHPAACGRHPSTVGIRTGGWTGEALKIRCDL